MKKIVTKETKEAIKNQLITSRYGGNVLSTLKPIEILILSLHFKINKQQEELSVLEISKLLNVSRQTIYNHINKGCRKLLHPVRQKRLKEQ